jgi:hypothetical protein
MVLHPQPPLLQALLLQLRLLVENQLPQ